MIRPVLELVAKFTDNVTAPLRSMEQGITGIGNDISENFSNTLKNMATGLVEFFAVAKLVEFFENVWSAGEKLRESQGALQLAIENTGGSLAGLQGKAEDTIEAVGRLSVYTDNDLRGALARLITDTGDTTGAMNNLQLVADVAAARHIDLSTAADLVAKAMEGNTAALKKAGIQVTTVLPLMDQLNTLFRGNAAAVKEATTGLAAMKQWFDGALESIAVYIEHPIKMFVQDWKDGGTDVAASARKVMADVVAGHQTATADMITISQASWDGQIAQAQAGGANLKGQDTKLNADLTTAKDKLNAAITNGVQVNADGTVTISKQAQIKILADEEDVAAARTALSDAVGKRQQEAAAKTQAAELAASNALQKLTNDFMADFAGAVPDSVAKLNKKITELIAQGELWAASTDPKIQAQAQAVFNLAAQYSEIVPILTDLGTLSADVAATEKDPDRTFALRNLNIEHDKAVTLLQAAGTNTEAIKGATELLLRTQRDITTEEGKQQAAQNTMKDWLDKHLLTTKELQDSVTKIRQEQEKNRDAIAGAATDAVGVLGTFGLIDDTTGKMLDDVIKIVDKMSDLSAATQGFTGNFNISNVTSLIGVVGTFGSLLGTLFGGESAESKAQKALMTSNNERLADLVAINGQLVLASDTGAEITGFQAFAGSGGFGALNAGRSRPANEYSIAELTTALRGSGLTVDEMRNVAKDLGIDLGEKDGMFSATGVNAFISGIATLGSSTPIFGSDFQGQQDAQTFKNTVGGITDPRTLIGQQVSLLATPQGSPGLERLLGSVNLTEPGGPKMLYDALVAAAGETNVSFADLGGLTSKQYSDEIKQLTDWVRTLLPAPSGQTPTTGTSSDTSASTDTAPALTPAQIAALGNNPIGSNPYATGPLTDGTYGTYTPPRATYTPPANSGISFDLSPAVDAIMAGFNVTNAHLAVIEDNTTVMADALAGGGFVKTINTGLQRDASITTRATGVA